ncbi:MAG TPA: HopJ type III effector protein [Gammaproteobacteria bacterium]|nr:HopJ type III effector protein [Gammaproteobacteria bacterium]
MTLDTFLSHLRKTPHAIGFDDTMALIDSLYDFTPTAFRNGEQDNAAGENNGSCKIFAFAQLNGLTEMETLTCFGRYYREDVLGDPDGHSHANIRNFMRHGWAGIDFEGTPLKNK